MLLLSFLGKALRRNAPAPARRFSSAALVPLEIVERKIFLIRGQNVMLSPHLAELYAVEPRALVQAVRRNSDRFPEDFMFQLTMEEFENLKSQFVISSWGGVRHAPYARSRSRVWRCFRVCSRASARFR
jgi:hypothetical protein